MEYLKPFIDFAVKAGIGWWSLIAGAAVIILVTQARGIISDILTYFKDDKKITAEIERNVKRDAELIRQKEEKRATKLATRKSTPKVRKP